MNLGYHCNRLNHVEDRVVGLGLDRGEFYNLEPRHEGTISHLVRAHRLKASIHCPLVMLEWYPTPPTWAFLCDRDPDRRLLNLRMIQDTLERAGDLGAEYVVAHFPSPDSTGAILSHEEARHIAWRSAEDLARLSYRHGLPIHIEGFGPSPLLVPDFLAEVVEQFPPLRYCFDTGHMSIAARRDGFDYFAFAQAMAPHIGSIHLWNTRGMADYQAFRHIPVHPCQKPEAGWVDVPRVLTVLRSQYPDVPVILESASKYPDALGDYDIRDGVAWIRQLLAT